jgi:hypothetical protein
LSFGVYRGVFALLLGFGTGNFGNLPEHGEPGKGIRSERPSGQAVKPVGTVSAGSFLSLLIVFESAACVVSQQAVIARQHPFRHAFFVYHPKSIRIILSDE